MGKRKEEEYGLIVQLQKAIRDSGQSLNQLSKLTGVSTPQLSRFMKGERGLASTAIDKICRALRLRLVSERPPTPKAAPGRPRGRGKG